MIGLRARGLSKAAFQHALAGWSREWYSWQHVHAGYAIVTEPDSSGSVRWVRVSDERLVRVYQPLQEHPGLFWDFAHLGERLGADPDNADRLVLGWVHRYGLLGLPQPGQPYPSRQEPLSEFIEAARLAHRLLTLYEVVVANDTDGLRRRVTVQQLETGEKSLWVPAVDGEPFPFPGLSAGAALRPRDLEAFALFYLLWKLRPYLLGIHPGIGPAERIEVHGVRRYRIARGWFCRSLLDAMMFQFYLFITASTRVAFCRQCGEPFELTRPNRILCNRCQSDNAPQKAYYWRTKRLWELAQAGLSPEAMRRIEPRARPSTVRRIWIEVHGPAKRRSKGLPAQEKKGVAVKRDGRPSKDGGGVDEP